MGPRTKPLRSKFLVATGAVFGKEAAVEFQLTAWMADEPGTLDRALLAFSRRRITPASVHAEADPKEGVICLTLRFDTASGPDALRVAHQVGRGAKVYRLALEPMDESVGREMALVRIRCPEADRTALRQWARRSGVEVAAATPDHVVVALAGSPAAVAEALDGLSAFSVEAVRRTRVHLPPGPGAPVAPGLPPLPVHSHGPQDSHYPHYPYYPYYPYYEEDISWHTCTTTATPTRP